MGSMCSSIAVLCHKHSKKGNIVASMGVECSMCSSIAVFVAKHSIGWLISKKGLTMGVFMCVHVCG